MVALLSATLLLSACGSGVDAEPSRTPPQLVGVGTVLDDGSGPEFCLGGVAQSLPPQCGGPLLVKWTWPEKGWEEASGTTWGEYGVVGTYDGERSTVTKTVAADSVPQPDFPGLDSSTPCSPPAGGWRAPDPARATAADQDRVFSAAERLPGFADSWIDDRGDSRQLPEQVVINVRVTGDVEEAEQALRAIWGGSLCVSKAKRTKAELVDVSQRLAKRTDVSISAPAADGIDLAVVYDDGSLQSALDEEFGPGYIRVDSALRPYRG